MSTGWCIWSPHKRLILCGIYIGTVDSPAVVGGDLVGRNSCSRTCALVRLAWADRRTTHRAFCCARAWGQQ